MRIAGIESLAHGWHPIKVAARACPADQGEPGTARRHPQTACAVILRLYHRWATQVAQCSSGAISTRRIAWERSRPTTSAWVWMPVPRSLCFAEGSDTSPHATRRGFPVRAASSRIRLNRALDETVARSRSGGAGQREVGMDYAKAFAKGLQALRRRRYRIFADIRRDRGRFRRLALCGR